MTARAPLWQDTSTSGAPVRQMSAANGDTIPASIAPGVPGIAFSISTTAANQVVPGPPSPYAFTVSSASTITAKAVTAATASTVYTVKKNGTAVATITFAASGTTATSALSSGAFSVAAGDFLTLVGPATADSTLAAIGVSVVGS